MLKYFFLKQSFINYIKNNFYFDFGLKILAKIFVYNIFIQLSFFFAEKYIIEYYTRYIFNYTGLLFNSLSLNLSFKLMYIYIILFSLNIFILFI